MSAAQHAVISGGTVTNVVLVDGSTEEGAAFLQALEASGDVVVDISTIDPLPAIGWTTADGGKTFTAPDTPPAAPSAQQQAQAQVVDLVASIPAHIAQAQTDAATVAGITAGQPLTAEQVTALANHANGWVTLLQALQTLTAALGYSQ